MADNVESADEIPDYVPPPGEEPLPDDVTSDFAPLTTSQAELSGAHKKSDPYHHDSLMAEESFQRGVEAAHRGDESEAVQQYLIASKRAEVAREWYLAGRLIPPRRGLPATSETALRSGARLSDVSARRGGL